MIAQMKAYFLIQFEEISTQKPNKSIFIMISVNYMAELNQAKTPTNHTSTEWNEL